MRSPMRALKLLLITGSLTAAGLSAATADATAATATPPTLTTTNFACANGVCEIGPGDVNAPFAAGIDATGGPAYYGPECNPYVMTITAGSLPPGLHFGEPACEYTITGTPTTAGTYDVTVQITPQLNSLGQSAGPSGTARLSITIAAGSADRLVVEGAVYSAKGARMQVQGYDANIGAQYTVTNTASGQQVIATQTNTGAAADGSLLLNSHVNPCAQTNPCQVTVTDSLGSSITVPVVVKNY